MSTNLPEGLPERWHDCWGVAVEETEKIGISGVKSWYQEALERIAELELKDNVMQAVNQRLDHIEYADSHGCATGDCPHDDSRECVEPLIEELKRVASVARGEA